MSNSTARHARLDALYASNVSCRVETWRVKWNLGFTHRVHSVMWTMRRIRCRVSNVVDSSYNYIVTLAILANSKRDRPNICEFSPILKPVTNVISLRPRAPCWLQTADLKVKHPRTTPYTLCSMLFVCGWDKVPYSQQGSMPCANSSCFCGIILFTLKCYFCNVFANVQWYM